MDLMDLIVKCYHFAYVSEKWPRNKKSHAIFLNGYGLHSNKPEDEVMLCFCTPLDLKTKADDNYVYP